MQEPKSALECVRWLLKDTFERIKKNPDFQTQARLWDEARKLKHIERRVYLRQNAAKSIERLLDDAKKSLVLVREILDACK